LAPKSMTLDDIERPKRHCHSCRNKIVFRSPPEKFEQTVSGKM